MTARLIALTLTDDELASLACVATGHHPDHCDCNDEADWPDRYCEDAHETFARVQVLLNARLHPGDEHELVGSPGHLRCACGWSPSLGESVRRAFDKHLLDSRNRPGDDRA